MDKFLEILDEKKKKIDSLRPLPKELIKNLKEWFTVELTYSSNGIEGNTLTKSETALVIEKGITIAGKSVQEHLEAINHSEAISYIKELAKKEEFSLSDVLGIHSIIVYDKTTDMVGGGVWGRSPHSDIEATKLLSCRSFAILGYEVYDRELLSKISPLYLSL